MSLIKTSLRTVAVAVAASVALTACGAPQATNTSNTGSGSERTASAETSWTGKYETGAAELADFRTKPTGQSPDLEELVESGELPPVEERLPEEAVTIVGPDGVGNYGGEMIFAMLDADDDSTIRRYAAYEPMVRWDPDWSDELLPGVADEWEVSDDATTFTFHLQPNIRWSDGEPFTADDIVFGYEEVLMNEELTPGPTSYLMDPGGNWPELTVHDDHTIEFQFEEPHGLFLYQLARAEEDGKFHRFPRHYLEQFHIDHNPDANELAEEEGFDDWADMFTTKGWVTLGSGDDSRWLNPELPTLNPYVIETPAYSGTRVTAVRNPYYWKVDEAGNQLPYIDRLVWDVFTDQEVIAFRAAGGNISFQDRHFDHDFRPLLAESMEEYDFSLLDVTSTDQNTMVFSFNHIHPDEDKREIFTNKDFRIGLSHALDREEIIELIYYGQGEPSQTAPRKESPFYNERLATQYLEFDLDLANEHLDKVLPEKDEDGMRLGKDGKPFSFSVDVATDRSVEHVDTLQLVQNHWREVGVDMTINTIDRDLRNERRNAGTFDLYVRDGSAGLQDAILRPHWYMPYGDSGAYAAQWGMYYTDGEDEGVAPPEDSLAWDQWEIYDEILVTGDPEKQAELMDELLEVSADAFWTIGLSTSPNRAGVRQNALRNAPYELYEASAFQNPGAYFVPSWYWADPDAEEARSQDEDAVQDEVEELDIETDEEED